MCLSKEQVSGLVPDSIASPLLMRIKPMQVREYRKWFQMILRFLLRTGKDFTTVLAGVKADGHSVVFECHDGEHFKIYTRTEAHSLLLEGEGARRFVTQLACDVRAHLTCELRALYDGQELGFLEVLAMLKQFKDNKMQNKGKLQLQLCPFGVFSINPEGMPDSARGCTFLSQKVQEQLLGAFIEPEGDLACAVEGTKYRARLYDTGKGKQDLEFLSEDGKQTIARGEQEFFDKLIAQADRRGIEGFVLSADPTIWGDKRTVMDMYGVRDQSKVKVKREFFVSLMACRVKQVTKRGTSSKIWVYGLDPNGRLVYAGDQTKHSRLNAVLPANVHAYTFTNKDEQNALFSLSKEQFQKKKHLFRAFSASCTNMSKNRYCPIGLKNHDMVFKPVDPSTLSVLKSVAEANPHFIATRAASDKFAEAIHRGEKKKAFQKRKRESQATPASLQVYEAVKRPRTQQAAPASLGINDFLSELGEEFKPPPRPPRAPSPASSQEETVIVQAVPAETVTVEAVPAETVTVVEKPSPVKHRVLFVKSAPLTTKLYEDQFAAKGWTLTFAPDPSVTLIVATADRINHVAFCAELQEKCPAARFTTLQGLKAELAA